MLNLSSFPLLHYQVNLLRKGYWIYFIQDAELPGIFLIPQYPNIKESVAHHLPTFNELDQLHSPIVEILIIEEFSMIALKMILMSDQWRTSKIRDELRYSDSEVVFNRSLYLTCLLNYPRFPLLGGNLTISKRTW